VMGGALLNVNPFGQPGVEAGKTPRMRSWGERATRLCATSCLPRQALKAPINSHPVDPEPDLIGYGS